VLLGLRGAGKSTLGPMIASRAGVPVVDLDDRTREALGHATVADAWREAGEPAFRDAEARSLRAALAGPRCVLALGGGTPTAPGAADALRTAAGARRITLTYLHALPDALRARLREGDANRPSLTGAGMLDEIDAVYRARDPLYRELATHIVDATMPVSAQIDAILRVWR
jgi:shikimate kinase